MKSILPIAMQILLVLSPSVMAATHTAANASYGAVAEALSKASSGDTVRIPPGVGTWNSSLVLPTKVTIAGAGINATTIHLTTNGIRLNNKNSRITGIKFISSARSSSNYHIQADCENWFEVDHCRFESSVSNKQLAVHAKSPSGKSDPKGLIHSCEFFNTRVIMQGDLGTGFGRDVWAMSDRVPGTGKTVFVEDCDFVNTAGGNIMDNEYGGHYVFRHNVVTDGTCEAHGITSLNERGNKFVEIYNNLFKRTGTGFYRPIFIRGGTARVFNNVFTGPWEQEIEIDNETNRSGDAMGDYPWPDQLGTGTDIGGEWPGSPTPFPQQEHWPLYQWNNIHDGVNMYAGRNGNKTVKFHTTNNAGAMAKVGRDFFDGVNAISAIGYRPYPYPHPGRSDSTGPSGFPPSIQSAPTAAGTTGEPFSYQIVATNDPTSYGATNLPAGLSLSGATIAGVPTQQGTREVQISATNGFGVDQKVLKLSIAGLEPELSGPDEFGAYLGESFQYKIQAGGNPTRFAATGLPPGLVIETGSGFISGHPTSLGRFDVMLSAVNAHGSDSKPLVIEVVDDGRGLEFSAADGLIELPFRVGADGAVSQSVQTTDPADGGRAVYDFTILNGGDYSISAKVQCADGSSNSFFVNVDDEPLESHLWNVPLVDPAFSGTDEVPDMFRFVHWAQPNGVVEAKVWSLTPGAHKLYIRGREAGAAIKQITIWMVWPAPVPEPPSSDEAEVEFRD